MQLNFFLVSILFAPLFINIICIVNPLPRVSEQPTNGNWGFLSTEPLKCIDTVY